MKIRLPIHLKTHYVPIPSNSKTFTYKNTTKIAKLLSRLSKIEKGIWATNKQADDFFSEMFRTGKLGKGLGGVSRTMPSLANNLLLRNTNPKYAGMLHKVDKGFVGWKIVASDIERELRKQMAMGELIKYGFHHEAFMTFKKSKP